MIRRVSFDLTGLPPSPEEVDAFVARSGARRLRAARRSPAGLARISASASPGTGWTWPGSPSRTATSRTTIGPFAYHYRDFLIRAFNDDMPYDQFVRWQLAGDELAPDDPLAMAATGFLGAGAFPTQLTEAEFESARYNELDDMVATTGVAFLGLSVGCARCHDHKYDPIPSEDYYRLAAVFTTTIRSEIDVAPRPGAKPVKVQVTAEGYPHTKHHADDRGFPHFYPRRTSCAAATSPRRWARPTPGVLRVLCAAARTRHDWKVEPSSARRPGTSYRRAALGALAHRSPSTGPGRLAARVIVNRLWQHHFGRGIVATPNDFGAQGEPPSHPELLDWLAERLDRERLAAQADPSADRDQCRLHAGQPVTTRPARRSIARTCSSGGARRAGSRPSRSATRCWRSAGRLDRRMYGPGSLDAEMPRRSVYFFIKRSQLIPMMMLFDWPEHLVSIGQRSTTTTAPQALAMLNSGLARHCAEGFAARVAAGGDPDARVPRGLSDRLRPRADRGRGAARRRVPRRASARPTPATAGPIPIGRRSSISARR